MTDRDDLAAAKRAQRLAIVRQLIDDVDGIDQNEFTNQDVLAELGRHGDRKFTRPDDVVPLLQQFERRGVIHRVPTGAWRTGQPDSDASWMAVDQM